MGRNLKVKFLILFFSIFIYSLASFADKLELVVTPILNDEVIVKKVGHSAKNDDESNSYRHNPNHLDGSVKLAKEKTIEPSWKKGHKEINIVLGGLLNDLADGTLNEYVPDLNKDALEQLAAAYLLCTKRQGPCEFMLETLLEIETLKSIKNNDVSCSNLKQFWKIWVDNNYEKMLNYDTKLGLIEKIRDFRANQMARYVKCDNSVRENFKKDYIPSKESIDNMKKTLRLMNLLEKKYGDVAAQFMSVK